MKVVENAVGFFVGVLATLWTVFKIVLLAAIPAFVLYVLVIYIAQLLGETL